MGDCKLATCMRGLDPTATGQGEDQSHKTACALIIIPLFTQLLLLERLDAHKQAGAERRLITTA